MSRESLPWIAVDVDGVLADTVYQTFKPISQYTGRPFGYNDIVEWDFPIGDKMFADFIVQVLKSPERLDSVPLVLGAAQSVQELYRHRRIAIVTARPEYTETTTLRWLARYNVPYDLYKHHGVGEKHKVGVPCELLIDDHTPNVTGFVDNTSGRGILFPQLWNKDRQAITQHIDAGRILTPVDWPDTVRMILNTR